MTRLAEYEQRARAYEPAFRVASLVFFLVGILLMLATASWRVLPAIAVALVHALVLGVTAYRAKRGRLRAVFRYFFLLVVFLVTMPFVLPLLGATPWSWRLATLSILAGGASAGIVLALRLSIRRLSALAREGRTDVDLPWALPHEPPGPE